MKIIIIQINLKKLNYYYIILKKLQMSKKYQKIINGFKPLIMDLIVLEKLLKM